MNKITTIIVAVASMTMLSSCATMFTGTTQKVTITSNPPAADVIINGVTRGVTPLELSIKKEIKGQPIELKKGGYESKTFMPTTTFNSTAILNIFTGLVGFAVDYATGSLMKYDPTTYDLTLEKVKNK